MSKTYTLRHTPPRERVLLISCMDLRLIDNLVRFMAADNLTNRYDQYIMAGTGFAAYSADPTYRAWLDALWTHLEFAYNEHKVRDVYIIQHRNCGMIKAEIGDFGPTKPAQAKEWALHYKIADAMKKEILNYAVEKGWNKAKEPFNVQCFMMDLRGGVKMLDTDKELKD